MQNAQFEYTKRANQHRPTDAEGFIREVRRLSTNGYSVNEIAGALKLDPVAVARMLLPDVDATVTTLRTIA